MKANPNVMKIVTRWLREHGYDGLFNSNGECACIRTDLAPCGELNGECEAGYKVECRCAEGGHEFDIQRKKPRHK